MSGSKYQSETRLSHCPLTNNRQQPWSTYALHIATFTSLSFAFDPLIIFLTFKATASWSPTYQFYALLAQLVWMCISKIVKLIGLFVREPSDLMFLPVSVLFGYLHGLIKLYALFTLRHVSRVPFPLCLRPMLTVFQTSWGSRADGDANDSHRMSPRARRSESITLPPGNHPGLIRYNDDKTYTSPEKHEPSEKGMFDDDGASESNLDPATDDSYDATDSDDDSNDDSNTSSAKVEALGR